MVERMEEREQPSTELRRFEGFLESTRVEKRTLHDLEKDVVVPLVMISSEKDLTSEGTLVSSILEEKRSKKKDEPECPSEES